MTLQERLTKIKTILMLRQPWFGQLASYLTFSELPEDEPMQTMAVDIKGNIYFSKKFVDGLTDEELGGVICHEILHLAFQHLTRLGFKHPKLFNIASDLKINEEIIFNQQGFKLPKQCCVAYGNKFNFGKAVINNIDMKTSEEIYKELLQKNLSEEEINAIGLDTFIPMQGSNPSDINAATDWAERVNVANETCKNQGKLPAGILRELSELATPQLTWNQIITQRLKLISTNKSWKKPCKRMLPYYFASKNKVRGLTCAICIDTSGSMSDDDLKQTLGEIWGLSQQFKSIKMYIMCCDTSLTEPFVIDTRTKNKLMGIKLKGGGGTSFKPVFNWIEKNNIRLDCLIYFTDLYGDFPDKKPMYPTYWITSTKDVNIPFGRLVNMK